MNNDKMNNDKLNDYIDLWEYSVEQNPNLVPEMFIDNNKKDLSETEQEEILKRIKQLIKMDLLSQGNLSFLVEQGFITTHSKDQNQRVAVNRINLRPGVEIITDYRLLERLGAGGFGEVWKVSSPGGFPVAMKFLNKQQKTTNTELNALEKLKGIRHPNLVSIVGLWNKTSTETEIYDLIIIVMTLADKTLADCFKEYRQQGKAGIPLKELIDYFREAAKAIDFLNFPGENRERPPIAHCDIKPENIFITGSSVQVGDLGVAVILSDHGTQKSQNHTFAFAAPECLENEGFVTQYSDQFSLAVTWFYLRTGKFPFAILNGREKHILDLSGIEEEEQPVIAKALSHDPKDRYASCTQFIDTIVSWNENRETYRYYTDYIERWGVPQGLFPIEPQDLEQRHRTYRFTYRHDLLQKVDYIDSRGNIQDHNEFSIDIERFPSMEFSWHDNFPMFPDVKCCDRIGKIIVSKNHDSVALSLEEQKRLAKKDDVLSRALVAGINPYIIDFKKKNIVSFNDSIGMKQEKTQNKKHFLLRGLSSMMEGADSFYQRSDKIQLESITEPVSFISRLSLEYTPDGLLEKVWYWREKEQEFVPCCDHQGIYGFLYKYDHLGRLETKQFNDKDGSLVARKDGIAMIVFSYCPGGLSQIMYRDRHNQPVQNAIGYCILKYEYDDKGRNNRSLFLDYNNQPCFISSKIAGLKSIFDEQGNEIKRIFLDTDGNCCYHKEGHVQQWIVYDTRGNVIDVSYRDQSGNPCLTIYWIAGFRKEYNEFGLEIKRSFYGLDGNPCLNFEGVSARCIEYDTNGNECKRSFFNEFGNPCNYSNMPTSVIISKFNSWGLLLSQSFLDIEGKPCPSGTREAEIRFFYDDNDILKEFRCYDLEGNLCFGKESYPITRIEYDDLGRFCSSRNFDENDQPCYTRGGYHQLCFEYDRWGNKTKIIQKDIKGQICIGQEFYAIKEFQYDENGNTIRTSFYDTNYNPCCGEDHCATFLYEYDRYNRDIKGSFYDENNIPCKNEDEEYEYHYYYNAKGLVVKETNPVYNEEGNISSYHEINTEYDEKNNPTFLCFKNGGEPSSGPYGFYRVDFLYNYQYNIINISFSDVNGNRCCTINNDFYALSYEYDKYGRMIDLRLFYLTDLPEIIVHEKYFYTSHGMQTLFYNCNNQLCLNLENIAGYIDEFNNYDCLIRRTFLDTEGNVTLNNEGMAGYICEYDSRGREVCCSFFDKNSAPISPIGYNAMVKSYDSLWRLTCIGYRDSNRLPCYNILKNVSSVKYEYDNRFNIVKETYFDINNKPCFNNDGYAGTIYTYDNDGNQTGVHVIDINGQKMKYKIFVKEIESEAPETDLKVGDELIKYNNHKLEDLHEFYKYLYSGEIEPETVYPLKIKRKITFFYHKYIVFKVNSSELDSHLCNKELHLDEEIVIPLAVKFQRYFSFLRNIFKKRLSTD